MSFDYNYMAEIVNALLNDLLRHYDERVPGEGEFPDVRVGRPVQFGDPSVCPPGRVELVVMNMDSRLDPDYHVMRFVSIRVMKSREGGFASLTCFHGKKGDLHKQLKEQQDDPEFLVDRISELSEGLPEETNPDIWR